MLGGTGRSVLTRCSIAASALPMASNASVQRRSEITPHRTLMKNLQTSSESTAVSCKFPRQPGTKSCHIPASSETLHMLHFELWAKGVGHTHPLAIHAHLNCPINPVLLRYAYSDQRFRLLRCTFIETVPYRSADSRSERLDTVAQCALHLRQCLLFKLQKATYVLIAVQVTNACHSNP
jgi:hypothetical protein